jgi:hypothetical protein
MDDLDAGGRRLAGLVGLGFGVLLHAIVGVFVFSTGLVAPLWATILLITVWLAAARIMWLRRRSPAWTLLAPVVTAAVWWAVLTAGDAWLGWTA